jgi:hypothetical protein
MRVYLGGLESPPPWREGQCSRDAPDPQLDHVADLIQAEPAVQLRPSWNGDVVTAIDAVMVRDADELMLAHERRSNKRSPRPNI